MALVTFLCRIAGVVLMSRVRITPRIERGLRALPGSIILATILPVVMDNGWPAIIARRGRYRRHGGDADRHSSAFSPA